MGRDDNDGFADYNELLRTQACIYDDQTLGWGHFGVVFCFLWILSFFFVWFYTGPSYKCLHYIGICRAQANCWN